MDLDISITEIPFFRQSRGVTIDSDCGREDILSVDQSPFLMMKPMLQGIPQKPLPSFVSECFRFENATWW